MAAAVVLDSSCAGLTRASIRKSASFKKMDCRVKPGNDSGSFIADARWYHAASCSVGTSTSGAKLVLIGRNLDRPQRDFGAKPA
jgi:hypothetical protein